MQAEKHRYVDDEVQESLFETQVDAEASEAQFVGLGDTTEGATVRLRLPSGQVRDVRVDLPPADEWRGSTLHNLFVHLGIGDRGDLDGAVDSPVPITTENGIRIDEERLSEVHNTTSLDISVPTVSEGRGDGLALIAASITFLSFGAVGYPIVGGLVGVATALLVILFLTPRVTGGTARN